ncbi:MAG: 50S ribosomal protein L19 [Verrucomicrobia bacterium]|nr:50S ribosomal protein L19 [Verrucomicrobiota bacterium]MBU1910666.1 50S ribosomal protein L19 [Verrucomicrobiota bacterium]
MRTKMLDKISGEQTRKEAMPALHIGDAVRVQVKIKEGDKERLQAFSGILIARDGTGATETITVRRVSYGEGVERVFPLHAPSVAKIEVEKHGRVRRAKLYYLRRATGKKARLTEVKN